MYGTSFPVSADFDSGDFVIPIGKAKVMREGTDLTIVSYSKGLQTAIQAAEQLAAEGKSNYVFFNPSWILSVVSLSSLFSLIFFLFSFFFCESRYQL